MARKIKLLIVDDSRTARALIRKAVSSYDDIEVAGEAGNPIEARDMIIQDQPDVITLDVEMPGMNGLQFLEKIMRLRPIPVVMVSSLTEKGANVAIKALQMGAFECYPKNNSFSGLPAIIKEAANFDPKKMKAIKSEPGLHQSKKWHRNFSLIGIGASTGGVEAIEELIKNLPAESPPIMICQHMPALYTGSFANRLNHNIPQLDIAEARDMEILKNGMVRIAPGGDRHLGVIKQTDGIKTRLRKGDLVDGHRPSITYMFKSIADTIGRDSIGIILTGMGRDGASGLLALRKSGGYTIAQDKTTAVVYGMPRVAHEIGAAEHILPLPDIPKRVLQIE